MPAWELGPGCQHTFVGVHMARLWTVQIETAVVERSKMWRRLDVSTVVRKRGSTWKHPASALSADGQDSRTTAPPFVNCLPYLSFPQQSPSSTPPPESMLTPQVDGKLCRVAILCSNSTKRMTKKTRFAISRSCHRSSSQGAGGV